MAPSLPIFNTLLKKQFPLGFTTDLDPAFTVLLSCFIAFVVCFMFFLYLIIHDVQHLVSNVLVLKVLYK